MTIKYCVTVFTFICFVDIYAGVVPDKIYYCMDPDTKILHPVNSSWPSSTFCGNYTCRMRKKGQMDLEYSPSNNINKDNSSDIDKNATKAEVVVSAEEKSKVDALNILDRDLNTKTLDENDRYLTEDEIKTITTLLHKTKKSDLDAIIEIYELAQNVYKEMDKKAHSTDEAPTSGVDKVKMDGIESASNKHVSYWYEPINVRGSVIKAQKVSNNDDIGVKSTYVNHQMRASNAQTYYQPIGHFQKKFSYAHIPTPFTPVVRSTVGESDSLPCDKPLAAKNVVAFPWFSKVMRAPFSLTSEKKQKPSLLLPYPSACVHHYNVSSYPRSPYFTKTYLDDSQKLPQDAVFLVNGDFLADISDLRAKLSVKRGSLPGNVDNVAIYEQANVNSKATGLNDPIPTKVPNSIINVNKHKPLLIRKMSIENYSDSDKNIRFKRESVQTSTMSIEYDNFETYIEKTECKSDTEPGFFAKGNESQPFPGCCPQRIEGHFEKVNN